MVLWLSTAAATLYVSAANEAARLAHAAASRRDAVIAAYADALFPARGPVPVSGGDAGAVRYMQGYIARSAPRARRLVELLVASCELGPLVFGPRRACFTHLSADEQRAYLAEAMASPLYLRRITVLTMRTLLTMAYFASDEVRFHLGIDDDPDPFAERFAPKHSSVGLTFDALTLDAQARVVAGDVGEA
jgi:hypothetical protein